MSRSNARGAAVAAVSVAALAIAFVIHEAPSWAAEGLLHPARRPVTTGAPAGCEDARFEGAGVMLAGWRCRAPGSSRGTVVYLHGVADNRAGAAGVAAHFNSRGLDVVAYDSRAHGQSGGDTCTYGFFEKQDLRRVLNEIPPHGIVLMGTSLGAAVALQEAADDPRVTAVVAAEVFSDLRTVGRERAPAIFTNLMIRHAFTLAEQRGRFSVDEVSPVLAAAHIHVPVLLIHGRLDRETTPDHSGRVLDELRGPKRLILVDDAGHNESLRGPVWRDIDEWIDAALKPVTKS
jgi:alpha-beta hydrolase superfamily lysophospholipase